MSLDHEAIYKAYAGTVTSINDSTGAFDKDGKSVTLDQSKIDAARATLNAEYAAL